MGFAIEGFSLISSIQSILLIISALLIIIAVVGVLKIDENLPNVVYARIHILGLVDIAGIIAFIALNQFLFAVIYLFLAPLLAHALANAYYHGEDNFNKSIINSSIDGAVENVIVSEEIDESINAEVESKAIGENLNELTGDDNND